ncbi:unnamed protein product [marine sediment metagenome]|uniref:Uncharacterized protein n=1 Tax=marine sediment metagenome TaxID=412755 RepID=X1IAK4_9ZZZZ
MEFSCQTKINTIPLKRLINAILIGLTDSRDVKSINKNKKIVLIVAAKQLARYKSKLKNRNEKLVKK